MKGKCDVKIHSKNMILSFFFFITLQVLHLVSKYFTRLLSFLYVKVGLCVRAASSPSLVDVRALAGGTGRGRLGERSRVQDPLRTSVHCCLMRKKPRLTHLSHSKSAITG